MIVLGLELLQKAHESLLLILTLDQLLVRLALERDAQEKGLDVHHRHSPAAHSPQLPLPPPLPRRSMDGDMAL